MATKPQTNLTAQVAAPKAKPTFAQLRTQEVRRRTSDFLMGSLTNPPFTAEERTLYADALEASAKMVRAWT